MEDRSSLSVSEGWNVQKLELQLPPRMDPVGKCLFLTSCLICLVHLTLEVLNFKLLIRSAQVSPRG